MNTTTEAEARVTLRALGFKNREVREMEHAPSGCPWRCQIGRATTEGRKGNYGRGYDELVLHQDFFELIAFGRTWADALAQLEGQNS